MPNNFLKVDYDKFASKTVTTMKRGYEFPPDLFDLEFELTAMLRHVSMPGVDSLVLDLIYKGRDWFWLRSGNLTININDVENIVLKPHEIPQPPENYRGEDVIESDWYELDQNLLKKICDAKSIDFKIAGEVKYKIANGNRFIYYAQMFYNSFYEEVYKEPELAYTELLIKEEEKFVLEGSFSDDERVEYREFMIKSLKGEEIPKSSNNTTTSSTASNSGNGCIVTLLMTIGALSSLVACFCFILNIF